MSEVTLPMTAQQHPHGTGSFAALLRRILAWLERPREAQDLPEPAEIKAIVAEKPPVPTAEDDVLSPKAVCERVAALLWAHRDAIEITLDYDESNPFRGRHSDYRPHSFIRLPGGVTVSLRPETGWAIPMTSISAPDGQKMEIKPGYDGLIHRVMRSIITLAIVDDLGLGELFPDDIEDDGTQPCRSHPDRLAEAIGRFVEQRAPSVCTETYIHREDMSAAPGYWDEVRPSLWTSLGEGILLRAYDQRYRDTDPHDLKAIISHPTLGVLELPPELVHKGLERRKSTSLADALGMAMALPAPLLMPRGNAQAARVLRLCREAVAAEPDLADASGTPIRPLVDQHLPELMRRHAAASAIAPTEDLASIDAELMEGIDRVRKAVDEALACSAVARRTALRTQLRFLELRHPDAVPLLEPITERQAA